MNKTKGHLGAGVAGFASTLGLLLLPFISMQTGALESVGWQGGQYGNAFLWIALGSVICGVVLKVNAPPPWRSFGTGMIIAGTLGVVLLIAFFIVLAYALSDISVP